MDWQDYLGRYSLGLPDGRRLEWAQVTYDEIEEIITVCGCDEEAALGLRTFREEELGPDRRLGLRGIIDRLLLLKLEGRIAGYLLFEINAWEGYETKVWSQATASWLEPVVADRVRFRLQVEYDTGDL